MDALLLTPVEAARALGIGRTKVYELITAGRLRSVRLDGCRRITRDDLAEFVAQLSAEAA
jgi:excisionase family DNA binding protein